MERQRKIELELPEYVVNELDSVARRYNIDRSGLIREATRMYLTHWYREDLREQLKQGYEAMGSLNLELAES